MKKYLCWLCIIGIFSLGIADEKTVVYPQKLSYEMSLDETFEVVPKPGWTMYPQKELALRFGSVLIRGPKDEFSMQLNFICDTKNLAKYDTPEKMKRIFQKTMVPFFNESLEKQNKVRVQVRPFSPFGRFGFAMRISDKKYADSEPPADEWKYLTSGAFRAGNDSVLMFSLMTNTVDDQAYLDLLDYIAAFAIPEKGDNGWKVASAAEAYKIAEQEFAKRYSPESLMTQKPYSVSREGGKWRVWGNMWVLHPGGVAMAEIDGATGEVLSVTHGK